MLLLLARLLLASSTQLSRLPPLFGGTEKVSRRDAVGLPESLVAVSPGQEEAAMWFAARASRESREVTLDEMVYNSLCSRISCDQSLSLDPVTIHSSIWNCTFQALEDPVDGLVSCAQRAVRRGVGVTRYQLEDMVKRACTGRPCSKRLQKPLTFHLTPIGLLTVEPWEEPAEVVEKFARTLAFGSPMARDVALLIVDWFCSRRECRRHVHEDIAVTVDGALYECSYWEPPEVAVTRSTDDVEVAKALLQYYCERKECGWRLERTLELKVWSYANSSVGTLRCGMLEDPADCVETFVRKSLSNFGGVRLLDNDEDDLTRAMEMMMAWLCRRRYCSRALAPEIQLGEVVARPWEEPWKVVATYAKQNRAVSEESMRSIYSDICRHRYFCANLPQHVGVSFDGVGNITCRSWEQPADVVESFAYQAVHAGHVLRASDLQYTLDLICSQRHCARNKLSVVATALVMHPGKTAGRALATALRSVPNIFVLGHDAKCGDDSRPCFVVLRHPLDRFVSALAFKKQGGEWGGELLLGNLCHRWLSEKHVDDIVDDVDGLNAHCGFNNATSDLATHCIFRPLSWWVGDNERRIRFMCYDRLRSDFDEMIRPRCEPNCSLVQQNPSNHSLILGHSWDVRKLQDFVSQFYREDLALYERHCPLSSSRD